MHGQKLKIFKRPKNREDGSDFDDFRIKKLQPRKLFDDKISNDQNEPKFPEKFDKFSK